MFFKIFDKIVNYPTSQNTNPLKYLPNGCIEFNLSYRDEYYTQRNNKIKPYSSCNTTALVNSLVASNIPIPIKEGIQPEDYFTEILSTPKAYKVMSKIAPGFFDEKTGKPKTEPRYVAIMLSWVVDYTIGKKLSVFCGNTKLEDIVYNIVVERGACMALGTFTKFSHFVSVVGFITKQSDINVITNPDEVEIKKLTHLIIDDPYGSYHTNYEDHNGNDIRMSVAQYEKMIWGEKNSKTINLFRRKGFVRCKNDNYTIENYKI